MLDIRPVSDLRNKFSEIEETVKSGQPVYLTKNGYGSMVVLSLEQYAALTEKWSCAWTKLTGLRRQTVSAIRKKKCLAE